MAEKDLKTGQTVKLVFETLGRLQQRALRRFTVNNGRQDRKLRLGVEFANDRLLGVCWEIRFRAVDRLAHVERRLVDVDRRLKLKNELR